MAGSTLLRQGVAKATKADYKGSRALKSCLSRVSTKSSVRPFHFQITKFFRIFVAKMNKRDIYNRIEYIISCVGAFAQRYHLSNVQAYAYLRRHSGIDFLLDCYAAEHTLSIDDTVEDLQNLCYHNGGRLA